MKEVHYVRLSVAYIPEKQGTRGLHNKNHSVQNLEHRYLLSLICFNMNKFF